MIFILESGIYDKCKKEPDEVIATNHTKYNNYDFILLREDKKESLNLIAEKIIICQLYNPKAHFIVDYPSYRIDDIFNDVTTLKFVLKRKLTNISYDEDEERLKSIESNYKLSNSFYNLDVIEKLQIGKVTKKMIHIDLEEYELYDHLNGLINYYNKLIANLYK